MLVEALTTVVERQSTESFYRGVDFQVLILHRRGACLWLKHVLHFRAKIVKFLLLA